MRELKTKFGQSPQELAAEFVKNLADCKSGSEDMDLFFDSILQIEFSEKGKTDEIIESISHVNNTPFDAFHIPIIERCHPKYTYCLLSWICIQSRGIPQFVEVFFSMLATHFYSTHSKDETISLTWLKEIGGAGKLLTAMQIFPYARAGMAVTEDGKEELIYNLLTPEDLYIVVDG